MKVRTIVITPSKSYIGKWWDATEKDLNTLESYVIQTIKIGCKYFKLETETGNFYFSGEQIKVSILKLEYEE